MEKHDKIRLIGASIGFVLCVALIIFTSNLAKKQHAANIVSIELEMRMLMEAGYAQGQADALKGIVRIHSINDSTYVWTSSPWGTLKVVHDTITVNIKHR